MWVDGAKLKLAKCEYEFDAKYIKGDLIYMTQSKSQWKHFKFIYGSGNFSTVRIVHKNNPGFLKSKMKEDKLKAMKANKEKKREI